MTKTKTFSLFTLVCTLCFTPASAQEQWQLRRDRDDIQVYTRKVEGSPYDKVKVIMVLEDIRISSMVALVRDYAACSEWADRCAQSYLYEEISEREALVYTHNNLPFPVKDRDILSRMVWSQNPETLEVVARITAENGVLEEVKGRLRLTNADVNWYFTPLPSGAVQVSNEAHIDPGSTLPGWLINMLLVDTPFDTLHAFREKVQDAEYKDAQFGFIAEPSLSLASDALCTSDLC